MDLIWKRNIRNNFLFRRCTDKLKSAENPSSLQATQHNFLWVSHLGMG